MSNVFELLPSDIWNYEISKHLSFKDKIYLGNSCCFMKNVNIHKNSSNINADCLKINSDVYFKYKDIVDELSINKTIVINKFESDTISLKNIIADNIIVNGINIDKNKYIDLDSIDCDIRHLSLTNVKINSTRVKGYNININNCQDIYKLFSYNLKELVINNCRNLKENEYIIPFIPSLENLSISYSNFSNINSLKNLKSLSIESCYYIHDINNLRNLNNLSLKKSYIRNIEHLSELKNLELVNNDITDISYNIKIEKLVIISSIILNTNFDTLSLLNDLTLYDCSYVNDSFINVKINVKKLNISYISELYYFNLLLFPNTENLTIKFVNNISSINSLKNLQYLNVSNSSAIQNIQNFENLEKIIIKDVKIEYINDIKNLNYMVISNCNEIGYVLKTPKLEVLRLKDTEIINMDIVPLKELTINSSIIRDIDLKNYTRLKILKIIKYDEVIDLIGVKNTLESLVIEDSNYACNINNAIKLRHLKLINSNISCIDNLTNLNNLSCTMCNKINDISKLSKLNYLFLYSCERIKYIPEHIKNDCYIMNCKYM
jgi:hypothetical protein